MSPANVRNSCTPPLSSRVATDDRRRTPLQGKEGKQPRKTQQTNTPENKERSLRNPSHDPRSTRISSPRLSSVDGPKEREVLHCAKQFKLFDGGNVRAIPSSNFKSRSSPTKLVVAFDIGTTYSGVSYCIRKTGQVPEFLGVMKFPAQELVRGEAKVPSLLYYDKNGNVRAAGAEVLTESVTEAALTEGWAMAEWWKLHLRPSHLASCIKLDDDLPPLPPGKSAVDVLADFIKYLFQCAKSYIQEHHPVFTWSSVECTVEYIFTHPNDWDDIQQLYHQAIELAGLVSSAPEKHFRTHMLTEGEANLHFCARKLLSMEPPYQAPPRGIAIIDAGGGTIDLSMFSMTCNPVSCEETTVSGCRLQGSAFVTLRAKNLLQRKLEGWEHSSDEEISDFTREFDQSTKLIIKSDQEPAYVRVGGRSYNNPTYNISFGQLKLTGEEATSLFDDSINAVINAFEEQQRYSTIPITMAFLVGGFSANNWLWSQLQLYFQGRNIGIYRPDNDRNKAVADGAVSCHVASQLEPSVYEVIEGAIQNMKPAKPEQRTRAAALEAIKSLRVYRESSDSRISHFRAKLDESGEEIQSLRAVLRVHEQKHECETLYTQGRIKDAADSFIEIVNTPSEAVRTNKLIMDWITEFTHRCVSGLEMIGDGASKSNNSDDAVIVYSTALSLCRSTPTSILSKWASALLIRSSVDDALTSACKFKFPRFDVFRAICEVLERKGCFSDAVACFQRMQRELAEDTSESDGRAQWELEFQQQCRKRLERLGDVAMMSEQYHEAAKHLSTILSLNPVNRMDMLVKRSKAQTLMKLWDEALSDADDAIKLDSSSHLGYEIKHAALHGMGRHTEAVEAFDLMLSKLDESADVDICKLRRQYVDARPTIQRIVEETIRPMPRVLIDTTTGRLCDKQQQAEAFELLPVYNELVSSMATRLDRARIQRTVKEFYRYVMLSHKWEDGEPLLQHVKNISVYDLKESPTNTKLQRFCLLIRNLGFLWAWSDTCCIDKDNNVVLQESLVAMFMWYRGSALTIVYLWGVSSQSHFPGLRDSIWNTRAWTYQEYVAARIIRFYTEDWKPYLGLTLPNHKDSLAVVSEMQQATGVSAQEMAVLEPGLDRVREKLYLASKRKSTLAEDAAYSLFGIFGVSLPVVYTEGNRAVGRLLEHVLTGSGDIAVLAWTGTSGNYNSCLPRDLTVYDPLVPPHIPPPVGKAEMDSIVARFRSSFPDLSICMELYQRLSELPSPSLVVSRLRLPGISSPITELVQTPLHSETGDRRRLYRATTLIFGDIEIKTMEDLDEMKNLRIAHPWIQSLLDQEHSPRGTASLDKTTCALRLVARLRQSFGALLFTPVSRTGFRRVAADSLIMARIGEKVLLETLMDSINMFEIL